MCFTKAASSYYLRGRCVMLPVRVLQGSCKVSARGCDGSSIVLVKIREAAVEKGLWWALRAVWKNIDWVIVQLLESLLFLYQFILTHSLSLDVVFHFSCFPHPFQFILFFFATHAPFLYSCTVHSFLSRSPCPCAFLLSCLMQLSYLFHYPRPCKFPWLFFFIHALSIHSLWSTPSTFLCPFLSLCSACACLLSPFFILSLPTPWHILMPLFFPCALSVYSYLLFFFFLLSLPTPGHVPMPFFFVRALCAHPFFFSLLTFGTFPSYSPPSIVPIR